VAQVIYASASWSAPSRTKRRIVGVPGEFSVVTLRILRFVAGCPLAGGFLEGGRLTLQYDNEAEPTHAPTLWSSARNEAKECSGARHRQRVGRRKHGPSHRGPAGRTDSHTRKVDHQRKPERESASTNGKFKEATRHGVDPPGEFREQLSLGSCSLYLN
jgi:hypothetical protein